MSNVLNDQDAAYYLALENATGELSLDNLAEITAADVTFTPAGSLAAVTVQDALEELDSDLSGISGGGLSPSDFSYGFLIMGG